MQVTKFNLVTDLQIMLSNVTHSNFYFECNTERGSIDQLYIELGKLYFREFLLNIGIYNFDYDKYIAGIT